MSKCLLNTGENYTINSFVISTFTRHYYEEYSEEDEMIAAGCACAETVAVHI
jgi:hypothetical protein